MTVTPEVRARVLLVDDDVSVREFVSRLLGGSVSLSLVESAEEARELLSRESFSLALIDVFLPGDDGLSLLSEIRRHHPGTKIVIFTGRPSEAVTRSVVRGQADDYLEKPFTPDQIREVVSRLTQPGRPQSRFDEVCNHIRCHLNEDLRLSTVAARFQMQPSSFSQWFNAESNRRSVASGYKSFIINARLDRAQQLLATTDMLIKEIAHAVGFSSHQLLNQHFQERHNMSPSQWRDQCGPLTLLSSERPAIG